MATQSMVMGDAFGQAFQYGKRKISAMSNEEFNKTTMELKTFHSHTWTVITLLYLVITCSLHRYNTVNQPKLMIASVTPLQYIFFCHIHTNITSLINSATPLSQKGMQGEGPHAKSGEVPVENPFLITDRRTSWQSGVYAGEELIPGVQPP